ARRMSSAISFGVFWRFAPSTSAIIRSRNASPGLAVISTMSQSDSTWVPPVTALRSPPLSRMTGALSPVMAASLTEATPSTTVPSTGINSLASADHRLCPQERGQDRSHVDDEHDRIPHLTLRRQLAKRVDDRLLEDRRVEQRARLYRASHGVCTLLTSPRRG